MIHFKNYQELRSESENHSVFLVLNLQGFATRVKRLEIPIVIDTFSCIEIIINIGGDKPWSNF